MQIRRPAWRSQLSRHSPIGLRLSRAFTLIEIMVVVAIMGLILATGIPSIYRIWNREGMRQAVIDVLEVLSHARAQAIFSGSPVEVVFFPLERRFQIGGAPQVADDDLFAVAQPQPASKSGQSGSFPDGIAIEMLDVNLQEYRESDFVRVRFFPNGMCDEMTLILRSDKAEWRAITLEVTTGLTSVESNPQNLLRQ
jgi:prepilin-type N-terminal cleavage/methylation domain-containing protein